MALFRVRVQLKGKFDGTHDTQAPIPVGETFTYEVSVPDPGAYWYHPHIREDYTQEMGLYGSILVEPAELGRRKAALHAPAAPPARGYARLYHDHVLAADQGRDFDFLQARAI